MIEIGPNLKDALSALAVAFGVAAIFWALFR
mgnify:FL=1